MKKMKIDCGNSVNPKVVRQLWEIIDREGIALHQKCSIFLEMMESKKMNEELVRRNNELIEENAALSSVLEGHKENANNSESLDEVSKFDVGSKISSLNYEIRRLNGVICEMQKKLSRNKILTETEEAPQAEESGEKKNIIADSSMVANEVYRKIAEEYGDLKAKMAGLESKHCEELCERDQRITKLQRELNETMLNSKDAEEKCNALKIENEKWREAFQRVNKREINLSNEISQCSQRVDSIDKNMQSIMSRLGLWKRKVEQISIEKEELCKVMENYKSYEKTRNRGCDNEQESLEEEIANLIESLDKSLSENKALVTRLETVHRKNRELEGEVISLKMSTSDLSSKNIKLELDIKHLRMERSSALGDPEDKASKIRKLENSIEESGKLIADYKKRLCSISAEKEETEKMLESVKKQNREIRNEISRLSKECSQIDAENKRLSGILKAVQNGDSEGDPDLAIQLERYRGLLRCSLCDTRFKNTAIIKCMHCFCEECVNSRIRMRDRKCPSCNEPFSPNDVRKIYL
ncbi:RING finger subclass HC Bre1-like protein [Encephalitozoon hellem]|nr:RING finger subclass HC Bre1-like protein [Encephalitozoon hellem]